MRRFAALFVLAAGILSAAPGLVITTQSLPPAVFGAQYAPVTLDTSGDPGPFQWSIVAVPGAGSPPPGFVVGNGTNSLTQGTFCYGFNNQNGTASCFGNVQAPLGSYTFIIKAVSLVSQQTAQQQYTLQVLQALQFVTKSPLPGATANTVYSTQLVITGGSSNQDGAQFTWAVTSGSLPAGITLDPNSGLLSGLVSNGAVPSTFTVQVTDVMASVSTSATFTIDVQGGVTITTTSVPNATIGQPYPPFQFQAVNAPGFVWSVLRDTPLPAPFSLSSSGLLTGSGQNTGAFPFTVLLSSPQGAGVVTSKNFVLYITLGPLSIKETTLPIASQNVLYRTSLTPVGGLPPYSWSFDVPNPQGLTIAAATGAISGTPTTAGNFTIPVTIRDATGATFSVGLPLTVTPAISITTASLPDGSVNVPYFATVNATGGGVPYPSDAWSVTAGALPPGLSLNAANGQISGTPTTNGKFTFTLQVADFLRTTASKAFTITIGTVQPLTITSGDFSGNVLVAFSQTLTATGGTPPYTWSISSGTLPGGLQLNSTTGVISGTPSPGGASQLTVTVTDVNGLTASKSITITIISAQTPAVTVGLGSTTQPTVSLTTSAPYPLEITGFLTLTFASSAGGTDGGEARFSDGTRKLFYVVRANTTQGLFTTVSNGTPAILTGTVAGTITLTTNMSAGGQDITPSPAPTKTIVIAPAVPVITSVTLQQVTGGLNVVVTGYSNTREVSSGTFSFSVSSGNTLSVANLVVPLTSAYATWFNSAASSATGGQFKLTVPFSVTQGTATAVTKVSVTLTNAQGTSAAVSSQ